MTPSTSILTITPTQFLRYAGEALRQRVRLTIHHAGAPADVMVSVSAHGQEVTTPVTLQSGESLVEIDTPEVTTPCEATFTLLYRGKAIAATTLPWTPPRRWVVHVVQLSHHDVGYTDLASHVLHEHARWLDAAIEMAEATRAFPDDARFRLVIEQTWSIDHFLRHASPERTAAMLNLLRRGDFELTALFGNLITELCGHETLARSVYHAFRLKREHGIPIISAEHNDIPGFSWGVSQVLTEAGIRFFAPGLPLYYNWSNPQATSFWDEAAIFGTQGMPGAFWWEAPSGTRLLFWCNNTGCGGDCHPEFPGLAERLQALDEAGYPYSVLRWPVVGGARDNSPYIDGYARAIRAWNDRWAYPRLVSSTNARFYQELLPQLPGDLPVWRGEVPGQDYPVGATSTALATGINRGNHAEVPVAEALAVMASALTDYPYQDARLFQAYEEVLWHDEHTWGHHLPCGPTACAAELEKAVHAHRGAALAHDVANKAMARVADAVRLDEPGLHLVVFNALPRARTGMVTTPLREIDNCGSTMASRDDGRLRGVLLQDRWHINPPPEIVQGKFDLIDTATGAVVPYQISEVRSPLGDEQYAAQRLGLGAGGKRYGFFEQPSGFRYDLSFIADQVPPLGYRTYRLRPRDDRPVFPGAITACDTTLENAWYRLELDPRNGSVCRLLDKETGRELVNADAPHAFGALIVRDPFGEEAVATYRGIVCDQSGPFVASLRVQLTAPGHPCIEQTYTLYSGEKRLDIAVHLLKDPTPLLEAYLAFPFHLPGGGFRYEGPLCILDPSSDLLPGAYADRLTVQNWVAVSDGVASVLWSSREAPVVSLGHLWPGRLSPAHSAVVRQDVEHPRQTAEDLRGGAIYSLLTANNCGTNFAVTQCGVLLFRYHITSTAGYVTDSQAADFGQCSQAPLRTIFTEHDCPRSLPPVGSFLAVDPQEIRLLTLKIAEDGDGMILRLLNTSAMDIAARVSLPMLALQSAALVTLAEEETGAELIVSPHELTVPVASRAQATVRLRGTPDRREES